MRYHIKDKTLSLGGHLTVRDDSEKVVFEIKGNPLRLGHQLTMRDAETGQEIIQIKQQIISLLPQYNILENGKLYANIKKKLGLIRENFTVTAEDGQVFSVAGRIANFNFTVTNAQGTTLAEIKSGLALFNARYTVDIIAPETNVPFIIALVVVIDMINHHTKD